MIQRYGIEGPGCEHVACSVGEFVLFTEHEADKAQAVARATAGLIELLESEFTSQCTRLSSDWWKPIRIVDQTIGDKLAELGLWEKKTAEGWRAFVYRPIELQDSGGSDE